jgi:hypothetical protein
MRKIRDVLRLRAGGLDPCLVELVRYLARWAAERFPESFGELDDQASLERRKAELDAERRRLHDRIVGEFSAEDLVIVTDGVSTAERDRGLCQAFWRHAGARVPLYPLHNSAERLLHRLLELADRDARAAERAAERGSNDDQPDLSLVAPDGGQAEALAVAAEYFWTARRPGGSGRCAWDPWAPESERLGPGSAACRAAGSVSSGEFAVRRPHLIKPGRTRPCVERRRPVSPKGC